MTTFPSAPRALFAALWLAAAASAAPARAADGPLPTPVLPPPAVAAPNPGPGTDAAAADLARAKDLFARLVAREAAFDPTTKQELYADSAVLDFSLQYQDGTVAPIPMTIADVRKAAAQSMELARQQGITETYADPVYTALGDGRVRVDCRVTFSDGGPESTMSQVMGPDPASGRFVVLAETVRMVEMPDSDASTPTPVPAPDATDPAGVPSPAGSAT